MTIMKMIIVPQKEERLEADPRVKARYTALSLLGLVSRKCTKQTKEPSNSTPYSEESVTGLKRLQKRYSEVLVTMKRLMPEPRP
jgi:hypothetical protein